MMQCIAHSGRWSLGLLVAALGCGNVEQPPNSWPLPTASTPADAGVPAPLDASSSPAPVSPTVSRHWSWQECGRIPGDGEQHAILSLALSADGTVLATTTSLKASVWSVATEFSATTLRWSQNSEGVRNVDISRDGSKVALSGDVRGMYDAADGTLLSRPERPAPSAPACLGSEFRFSPDGKFAAGKRYETVLDIFETKPWRMVAQLPCGACGQGVAFSPNGDFLTTPEGTINARTFTRYSGGDPVDNDPTANLGGEESFVTFGPDNQGYSTVCGSSGCFTMPRIGNTGAARHLAFSPEGQWFVAGGSATHFSTGTQLRFDPAASEALFTPSGDIIAGEIDGSISNWCRSE